MEGTAKIESNCLTTSQLTKSWSVVMRALSNTSWTGMVHQPHPQKACPVSDHLYSKEMLPNIQSETSLTLLHAIPLHPVIGSQGTEASTSPSASHLQEVAESSGVASRPPFLQTGWPKCPQSLLTRHLFQICCLPLDVLKDHNILFILSSPNCLWDCTKT